MSEVNLPHNHSQDVEKILKHMPGYNYFEDAAAIFQQLNDVSRLRIFWLLCHCEECTSNIATAVSMSNAAVSHHLKSLRLHGLIKSRRQGKEIYYTITDTETAHLTHKIVDDFFKLSCPSKGLTNHQCNDNEA